MNRRKAREIAFIFIFENTFGLQSTEEIIRNAECIREEKMDDFSQTLFDGVLKRHEIIDEHIEKNLNDWKKDRLSRTALSLLRLAVFEMMYCEDIPISVSINEAVELAKKYGTKEEASYINGVLGSISRRI